MSIRSSLSVMLAAIAGFAQSPGAKLEFETAAIKAPDPNYSGYGWNTSPGQITVKNMTLRQLVMLAYDVKQFQIEGGPKWLDADRWTIVARLPEGVRNNRNDGPMRLAMQSLLADRYQLEIHKDTKSMSAYVLTVAKGGPKLEPAEGEHGNSSNWNNGKAAFRGVSMERFARFLASTLDRPVLDQTGLAGVFNFSLEWSHDETGDGSGPSMFTALHEQLGLKLEGRKAQVEVLVIDRAEKPSEN